MNRRPGLKNLNSETVFSTGVNDQPAKPTRRQFLQRAAGAGVVLAGSAATAWANTHPHPSPQSLTYLDRRMYIRNMEVIAHIQPGKNRGGKMQMMSAGTQRYLFQQGDVFDVTNARNPKMYNQHGFQGSQLQLAYNAKLKKWILMTGAGAPITSSTPTAPNGKYDDPKLLDAWKNYKGLRGVTFFDATDPSKIVKLSEFSTGATGSGTHRNYYDGGKYAYLDTAPDDTFIHQPWYARPLINGNMIGTRPIRLIPKKCRCGGCPAHERAKKPNTKSGNGLRSSTNIWIRHRLPVCTGRYTFRKKSRTAATAATVAGGVWA